MVITVKIVLIGSFLPYMENSLARSEASPGRGIIVLRVHAKYTQSPDAWMRMNWYLICVHVVSYRIVAKEYEMSYFLRDDYILLQLLVISTSLL